MATAGVAREAVRVFRTPSWGFDWAKDACLRQLGDVTLANLDTHFDDVAQFIEIKYPTASTGWTPHVLAEVCILNCHLLVCINYILRNLYN